MIRRALAWLAFHAWRLLDPEQRLAPRLLPAARAVAYTGPAIEAVETVKERLKAIEERLAERAVEREALKAELLDLKAAAERHHERLKQLARDGRTVDDPYPFP